jgi:hypothetical protein
MKLWEIFMRNILQKKAKMMFDTVVDFLIILRQRSAVCFSLNIKKMSSIVYQI